MSSHDPAGNGGARARLLASIVGGADDAIVGIDLDGTITSWNDGAVRLLGYTEAEVIGRPMMTMVPTERHASELQCLARVHRRERVAPYATVCQHKDGHFVDLSVAIGPVVTADGGIVGTSMIARDIADAGHAHDGQTMLFREMRHRIRNLFALASSVVALSARFAQTPQDMAGTVRDRLDALARAHDLTLPNFVDAADQTDTRTTLHALLRTIVSPYDDSGHQDGAGHQDGERVTIRGPDVPVSSDAVASLALLLHEFATNAAKFGALSLPTGHVDVTCEIAGDELHLAWQERGGPTLVGPALREGFGTLLGHATVRRQLGGSIARDWNSTGLTIRLVVPLERLAA
jgi:PAS domain S-box-containing protein